MITLTKLNGRTVAINPDLITWIEVTPDTTVSLLGGDKIIVREPLGDVIARIVAYRQEIGTTPAYQRVLDRLADLEADDEDDESRGRARRHTSAAPPFEELGSAKK